MRPSSSACCDLSRIFGEANTRWIAILGAPVKPDVDMLVRVVGAALPNATPDAVASMFVAQIPHVGSETGVSLVDRITAGLPPATWGFADKQLERWPTAVAARALAHVRSLPSGPDRLLALCGCAMQLTRSERREALDGILDGTLPSTTWEYTKPMSYKSSIVYLIRTLPETWQEEWIVSESIRGSALDVFAEYLARREIDRLTGAAVRNMWARIDHAQTPLREIPAGYLGLVQHLPVELRQPAIARVRRCADDSQRLLHLAEFDDELTEAERCEVVEIPWDSFCPEHPRQQGEHLRRVRKHLSRVPVALRGKWLERVLSFGDDCSQAALLALIPVLSGDDRQRASDALVSSAIREGRFYTTDTRWDLLPDHALAPLLLRLKDDVYGWSRDQLIEHVIDARDEKLADRCLQPLVDALDAFEADACLEIVSAMTPWLRARSASVIPRALAELPVSSSGRPNNPIYRIERVLDTPSRL